MCATGLFTIVQRLKDASCLTAVVGLILILATGGAAAGEVSFGPQRVITTSADGAYSVFAADLDGDGDLDVLSASFLDDLIAWYENTDGKGAFGIQQEITSLADGAFSVIAADLDGDGDQDVLSASGNDNKIAWYENTDGRGSFGPQQVITTLTDEARSVFAADLDGDGDQDVLSASFNDDKIAWYENMDGRGSFGPQQVITTSADGAASVIAADIDGDGDLDVFSGSTFDDKVAWYENTDGKGAFGPQRVITTFPDAVRSIFAADIDHDGDQDVLSVSIGDGKIAWHKNTDGMGTFGPQQVIANLTNGANSVFATDIDGDSDQDVLFASPGDDKIAWFENINRRGLFGPEQNINMPDPDSDRSNDVNGDADNARSVFAADLDGDGDQDVLSASFEDDKIAWYENLRPPTAVLDWELYD